MKILLILTICLILAAVALATFWFVATKDARLDASRLNISRQTIAIYDADGNKIESASLSDGRTNISVGELHDYTVNAFIASEDRDFYSHHGLNYKRILKALYRNVTSMKFREGASTISQQLIKNTHLSGEKTIQRKLKEIKLTRQLEKNYSKDEILSMYLNTIYFGHSCYGISSAANFYFGVDARDLTLNQSATIVGLLASPNNYSPFKDEQKCIQRRNLVLKSMLECGFISQEEYAQNTAMPIGAQRGKNSGSCADYLSMVFEELNTLFPDPYEALRDYRVYTGLDQELQRQLSQIAFNCDHAVIVTNPRGGVRAFSSSIGLTGRQIGSTAKPVFVYAPALEEKKIHMFSKIDDSAVNYGGYSPENYDKKYHGNVTAEESIMKSYNIPAVKTLNALGTLKAAEYAAKMGIELTEADKNLSLALGGTSSGITIKQLSDCYSVFQRGGDFCQSRFIERIESPDGEIVYTANPKPTKVFSQGTCSLMNGALIKTSEEGTGRKLKRFDFDIAVKTGTCGNSDGNTDAYAICYTSDATIAVWLGDKDNKRTAVTGGNDCCEIAAALIENMYAQGAPAPLEKTQGTAEISIDRHEYEDTGNILLADDNSPALNNMKVKCLADNIPTVKSSAFSKPTIQKPSISVNDNSVNIVLCQTHYYDYSVYREQNGKKELIYEGKWTDKIEDCPQPGVYRYSVVASYNSGKEKFVGDEIVLPDVIVTRNSLHPLPDIADKDWFNS